MNENWCAFAIAILRGATVEQSFEILDGKEQNIHWITQEDELDMLKLRETLQLKEVAEIYNISPSNVAHRFTRLRKRGVISGGYKRTSNRSC